MVARWGLAWLLGPPDKLRAEEVGEQRAYLANLAHIEDDQSIFFIKMRRDHPIRNAEGVVALKCAAVGRERWAASALASSGVA